MELVIALVLFVGLLGSWFMLPGSASSSAVLGASTVESETAAAAHVNV